MRVFDTAEMMIRPYSATPVSQTTATWSVLAQSWAELSLWKRVCDWKSLCPVTKVSCAPRNLCIAHCPYLSAKLSKRRSLRGLRRWSAAAYLMRLRFRILPGVYMPVTCECCFLLSRGLCDGPITRPEKSCRIWCVRVWSRNLNNEKSGLGIHCQGL
jgi:hypothetical protein